MAEGFRCRQDGISGGATMPRRHIRQSENRRGFRSAPERAAGLSIRRFTVCLLPIGNPCWTAYERAVNGSAPVKEWFSGKPR